MWTCPTGGWGSTSAGARRSATHRRSPPPAPSSGTARWARSSLNRSPPARVRWPRPSRKLRGRRWSAAATARRHCTSSDSPTASPTSRPAAAHRSSCSRESRSPAWRYSNHEPRPVHRGQLEDAQDGRGRRGVRRRIPPARVGGRRRGSRCVRAVHRAGGDGRVRARLASRGLRTEHARARERRVHRRGLGAHARRARRARCAARAFRAPPVLRRDRQGAVPEGAGRARGRAQADAVRGRDRGGARGGRHPAQAAQSGPGGAPERARRAARRGRDRLRADLGDRHGQGRHPGAGPGGGRLRPRAGRRPRARGGRVHPDPLRRQRQPRQRRRTAGAARRRRRAGGRGLARAREARGDRRRRSAMTLPAASCVLVVLDGWGLAPPGPGNAVEQASTPVFDDLWARYPHTQLKTDGRAVGLPEGQMGNSEVGHLNLGAGSVIRQDLTRIDDAVVDGSLAQNEVLRAALLGHERVHLLGLVSDGGVHSSLDHLRALTVMAEGDVVVHAFTDGRDTSPHGGADYLAEVEGWGACRVGSVVGRYYAMDRDKRWERTQKALDVLLAGEAPYRADSGEAAVRAAYERGETDEFIEPTLVGDEARIREGDSVVCFNFRPDRMRQLVAKLHEAGFEPTTLTSYEEDWSFPVAFPPERPAITLSKVVEAAGGAQLHVAETEKYPHVTYFFGGGEEEPCEHERRELVPSPRDVPTYDHKPAMSAPEAADAFARAWGEDGYRFGIINFANADMVGHTGSIPAAIAAVEAVDTCLREVVEAVQSTGGVLVITADHGNADEMLEPDGSPDTAHSLNPVPLIVTEDGVSLRDGGVLADVAPTVLGILGIGQPAEMTARSLIA